MWIFLTAVFLCLFFLFYAPLSRTLPMATLEDVLRALAPAEGRAVEPVARLPQGLSAEPGPIKRWPYRRGIADVLAEQREGVH
jgi:hypothetical protein